MFRSLMCGCLVALAVLGSTTSAHARSDNRAKRIAFIHGLDAQGTSGAYCGNTFGEMQQWLRSWGHSAPFHNIGYYDGDASTCESRIDGHGSHGAHYPSGHTNYAGFTSHNRDTSIRHLSMHFMWWIYNNFSRNNVAIDVVAHSMGGLITRYGIDRVQRRDSAFPPYVHVEDVLTYGTPHGGASSSYLCSYSTQCDEMKPGSTFMDYLAGAARNPQGASGTDWTAMGSLHDGLVSETSGTQMDADHRVKVNLGGSYGGIGHSEYMHAVGDQRDADVTYFDRGDANWTRWYSAPRPVRWGDFALTYGHW